MFFFDALTPHGSRVARYAHAFGTSAVLDLAVAAAATALLLAGAARLRLIAAGSLQDADRARDDQGQGQQ
jgi:uncharacterized protein YceH (UPF0502 family)